jgi:hypothetical protein
MADKSAAAETAKKANPQLEALKKHHFWILAGILVITALVVWWMGTNALADQFKKDAGTNNLAFSSLMPYKATGVNSPPNEQYTAAVKQQDNVVGKGVTDTWQTLYDRQSKILTFNPRVGKKLGELVLLDMNERKAEVAKNSKEIAFDLENFHNGRVIEEEFDNLFAMLNLRRLKPVPAPAAGEVAPVGGGQPEVEGVVIWAAPRSTQQVMSRYKTTKTPSPDRYCVTQEDIWIFKSIFGVIQNINQYTNDQWLGVMNGNPLPSEKSRIDQGNVPIKKIDYCDVAQYAMNRAFGDTGRLTPLTRTKSDDPIFMSSGDGSNFQPGTTGSEAEDEMLLRDRYLDGRNYPVQNPAEPPISEFRQVFLQLTVLMDQRLVPVLISECAQAPFPIETRQVRMSLNEVDVIRMKDAGRDVVSGWEQTPHDVTVTLRGVVYIYLKPDQKRLGKGTDKEPGKREYGIPQKRKEAEAGI